MPTKSEHVELEDYKEPLASRLIGRLFKWSGLGIIGLLLFVVIRGLLEPGVGAVVPIQNAIADQNLWGSFGIVGLQKIPADRVIAAAQVNNRDPSLLYCVSASDSRMRYIMQAILQRKICRGRTHLSGCSPYNQTITDTRYALQFHEKPAWWNTERYPTLDVIKISNKEGGGGLDFIFIYSEEKIFIHRWSS